MADKFLTEDPVFFRDERYVVVTEASDLRPDLLIPFSWRRRVTFPSRCPHCSGTSHSGTECPILIRENMIHYRAQWEAGALDGPRPEREHLGRELEWNTVECTYPLCQDPSTHRIHLCPTLHGRCEDCDYRGHTRRDHALFDRATLRRYFEENCRRGILTQRSEDDNLYIGEKPQGLPKYSRQWTERHRGRNWGSPDYTGFELSQSYVIEFRPNQRRNDERNIQVVVVAQAPVARSLAYLFSFGAREALLGQATQTAPSFPRPGTRRSRD